MNILEKYDINGIIIKNKIGNFSESGFEFTKGCEKSFLKRRSNFNGIDFKIMTEEFFPYVKLDDTYIEKALYFNANETYDVTAYSR